MDINNQDVDLIGHIGGFTGGMTIQGNHAYIGEGPWLTVLGISTPAFPVVLGKSAVFPGIVQDVFVSGTIAYVCRCFIGGDGQHTLASVNDLLL